MHRSIVTLLLLAGLAAAAPPPSRDFTQGPLKAKSFSRLAFSLDGILFACDSIGGRIFALDLEDRTPFTPSKPFELRGETQWRFVPRQAWRSGRYAVRVGGELEDLAGNRPARLFDEEASGSRREARYVTIPFTVRSIAPGLRKPANARAQPIH